MYRNKNWCDFCANFDKISRFCQNARLRQVEITSSAASDLTNLNFTPCTNLSASCRIDHQLRKKMTAREMRWLKNVVWRSQKVVKFTISGQTRSLGFLAT